ncbi:MAG: hypothetical protein ACT443_01830 [Gemmatimonadota bacterium]
MSNIELSAAEAAILRDILKHDHNALLLELSRAESLEYKELLRPREAVVTKVLRQLDAYSSV